MQATSKHAFLPKINKIGTRLLNQTLKTARIWVQETKKKPHNEQQEHVEKPNLSSNGEQQGGGVSNSIH